MNTQIRRLFLLMLVMFAALACAATSIQFFQAPSLNADGRNTRTILHAAEIDRGPIIVGGDAVASSSKEEGSARFQRYYSQGPLYAHVTGYFSSVFSQASGIERASEDVLDGRSDALLMHRIRTLFTGSERQGGGVVLTLNEQMQQVAAEALGSRKGAVVALDPKTGAVLALYSSPSYDPNPLASFDAQTVQNAYDALVADPAQPLTNRAIAGNRYAPGSAFKILTAAALLENGMTPDTPVDSPVETPLPESTTTVSNIESTTCGNGKPALREAFARSCNTSFVIASQQLPDTALADMAERFQFGTELSIPLTVTPSRYPEDANAPERALTSIGQFDVQVTPMQMAMVAAAVGNHGVMMKPQLIREIVDADLQSTQQMTPTRLAEPISAGVASQLTSMMVSTVNETYGTGGLMALSNWQVAAKTGTAETGDGSGKANAWAVAFAPADDPQIAIAVLVEGDDEQPVPHGGDTAGPIARAVMEAGLQ